MHGAGPSRETTAQAGIGTAWRFDAQDRDALVGLLVSRGELAGYRLVRDAAVELTDCYLDTPDTRLARAGYALQLRTDGVHGEATLEALDRQGRTPVRCREIRQPLADASPTGLMAASGPVAERVRAVAGPLPLEPLLTARTHRDVFRVASGDVDAARIMLDSTEFGPVDTPFQPLLQRVDVEALGAPAHELSPLIEALRESGVLEPARLTGLEVGLAASGRDLPRTGAQHPVTLEPEMSASAAGQALLRQQLAAWRNIEPAVRLGDDPDALHQLRVTCRRLVAMLRLLESVPLPGALRLRRRLQAVMRRTSAVRDLEVQCGELETINEALPARDLDAVIEPLRRRRARSQNTLLRMLDSSRVRQLLAALDDLATSTPARHGERTIAEVAEALVRRRHRRVRRQARRVRRSATPENLHRLRLEAKKLRYVLEPLAALYGEPLQRYLRRLQRLQTILGDSNDAHHAIVSLEAQLCTGRRLPPAALFAMGRAAERQHLRIIAAGDGLPRALRRIGGRTWDRLRHRMNEVLAATPTTVAARE